MLKKHRSLPENTELPRHIAIIMDGNGRWAKKRGLARSYGHIAGAKAFKNILDYCVELGLENMTIYAFSSENWIRPPEEVSGIMKLLDNYLDECIEKLMIYDANVRFIGSRERIAASLINKMEYIEKNSVGRKLNLFIAINYGGRDEILNAVKTAVDRGMKDITKEDFSSLMYTAGVPDPDLIIRTAGEMRLSNFLLWQSAYSEFWSTPVLWPDFNRETLNSAIADYSGRVRRYGGIK